MAPRRSFRWLLAVFAVFAGWTLDSGQAAAREARLSAAVAFEYGPEVSNWLRQPGLSFIEAYAYFEDDLDESVMFGVDQEFFEGMSDPIRFPGADWMALVGVQRTGVVWLAAGTPSTLAGTPSDDRNWVTIPLGVRLLPNTWYRLRSVADFGNRRFVNFTIQGPNINRTVDLSQYSLDYPAKQPFDRRSLTYYVWAINAVPLGGSANRNASVYFDDVRYGVMQGPAGAQRAESQLRANTLESYSGALEEQPASIIDILLGQALDTSDWTPGRWYLERDEARVRSVRVPFARSGQTVLEVDATLEDVDYDSWVDRPR